MPGYRVLEPIFEADDSAIAGYVRRGGDLGNAPPIDRTAVARSLLGDGLDVSVLPVLDGFRLPSRMLPSADRMALAALASALRNLAVVIDPMAGPDDLTPRWYDELIDPASVRKSSDRYLAVVCSAQTARQIDDEVGAPAVAAIVASAAVLQRHPKVTALLAASPSILPAVTRLAAAHASLVAAAGRLRGAAA